MSQIVNMLDAKTTLSKLVHALEAGAAQEFIIARNGRPAARLVPLAAPAADASRRIGRARGKFAAPDGSDASSDAVRRLFEDDGAADAKAG